MFYLKKIISAWLIPPTSLIVLALLAVLLIPRRPRLAKNILLFSLGLLLVLSFYPVTDLLMFKLQPDHVLTQSELNQAQAIVVLGGGTYVDAPEYGADTLNRYTLERVRYAVALQRLSHLPILVTGGSVYGGASDAKTMQASIIHDFSGQVQWLEDHSKDTSENALYSSALLHVAGVNRIILVSQAWHLKRAKSLFEQEGLTVFLGPTGYATHSHEIAYLLLPHSQALMMSCVALHEWAGILVNRIFKGVKDDGK
ncbi:MAG: YdcF family protein [Betaproteobacteria bacterium]|nr:YdcF family protein [Betaproteobacteria bacterium]